MKTLDDLILKSLIFKNWTTLQIFANIFVLFLSLKYFDYATSFAIFFVASFLIGCNLLLLVVLFKRRLCSYHPELMENSKLEFLFSVIFFILFCLKSFFLIAAISYSQKFLMDNDFNNLNIVYNVPAFFICSFLVLMFMIYQITSYYNRIKYYTFSNKINDINSAYKLKFEKTYFFIMNNEICGFISGAYRLDLNSGLIVGDRRYPSAIVVDYLNLSGIEFNDLNEGHVKNMEMYGIS